MTTTAVTTTTEAPTHRKPTFHALTVAGVERLTDEAVAITFDVPDELRADYRFVQGQHLTLRTMVEGDDVRRSYSICSSATGGRLRVAVKRLEGGMFSAYAHSGLAVGDVVDVMTPMGHFYTPLHPDNALHYVALAAGSGITPVLSLLWTTLEVEPRSRFTLVYGNRDSRSIMFLEELQDLKNRYPDRVSLLNVLSREAQDVDLFSGRIDAAKLTDLLSTLLPADTVDQWYLCGPFGMVQTARQTLAEHGVDASRVHFELFHVDGEAPRKRPAATTGATGDGASAVTVVLDGRTTTFDLAPDADSILDATLRLRADAPYACKGGVCGTCRAKLVAGEVDMDVHYALEDDEVAAGFVLACQSHPTTDAVTLDFDQ